MYPLSPPCEQQRRGLGEILQMGNLSLFHKEDLLCDDCIALWGFSDGV